MSALLHPVGSQPARVYWRRRLVALLLAGALLALGLVAVNAALGQGAAEAAGPDAAGATVEGDAAAGTDDGTTADEAADDEAADDGAAADGPVACGPEQITLALTADARSYAAGVTPVFTVTITNVSAASCTIDAGEAKRQVLVTSGADRIWASTDCPAEPAERLLLLPAGAQDSVAVTWARVRSAEGCGDGLPEPRPGTYTAVASVAGVSSTAAVFELG